MPLFHLGLASDADARALLREHRALLSTALAYIVFFKIVTRSGPFAVMLVTMLIPVSAIAMGAAFLGEPIAAREIAGAIVISLALLLIDGRVLGRLGRSRPA